MNVLYIYICMYVCLFFFFSLFFYCGIYYKFVPDVQIKKEKEVLQSEHEECHDKDTLTYTYQYNK